MHLNTINLTGSRRAETKTGVIFLAGLKITSNVNRKEGQAWVKLDILTSSGNEDTTWNRISLHLQGPQFDQTFS